MSTSFDNYLESLFKKKIEIGEKLSIFSKKVKNSSKQLSAKGKIKFEVEKTKLELKKKYYQLGMYISDKFFKENKTDFVYDEKFSSLNKEIELLNNYISKIKKQKIKL